MPITPAQLRWTDTGDIESLDYGDIYFQRGQGYDESVYVFLNKNNLSNRFTDCKTRFVIGELGFGSGLNFLLAAALWQRCAPATAHLHFISYEKHPIPKKDLEEIYALWEQDLKDFTAPLLDQYPPMVEGLHNLFFPQHNITLHLFFGEAHKNLPETDACVDAWFLDGFAPACNPDMWQDSLFHDIAKLTQQNGTFSTFTAAGAVKRGLEAAGFHVEKTQGFGRKRDMLTGYKKEPFTPDQTAFASPLPKKATSIGIIGGGVAGCSIAHHLKQQGFDNITLYETAETIAAGASGNPVGIVYPKMTVDDSALGLYHRHAFCYSKNLLKTANATTGWTPCGVLHLNQSLEDQDKSRRITDYHQADDYIQEVDAITATDIAGVPLMVSALYQPRAGYLNPVDFCHYLARDITVKTSTAITGLEKTNSGWRLYQQDKEAGCHDIVVLANSHGLQQLFPQDWLELEALRGQITQAPTTDISTNLKCVICHDGYITPAQNSTHIIGATFQKEPYSTTDLRPADQQENLDKLSTNIPCLDLPNPKELTGRAAWRASTPDKLPVIGAIPDFEKFKETYAHWRHGKKKERDLNKGAPYIDGMFIATGFGAHGMTSAPLAGAIISALITGAPLPVPKTVLENIVPQRFILRGLKRNLY